jgi:hypothetical protein
MASRKKNSPAVAAGRNVETFAGGPAAPGYSITPQAMRAPELPDGSVL